jgi:hypothetical protein
MEITANTDTTDTTDTNNRLRKFARRNGQLVEVRTRGPHWTPFTY